MESARRILVVEDQPQFSRALTRVLSHIFGFDVTVAETGEEAVERFANVNPDVLFLDMHLPGINGHETLKIIRSLPNGARLPVVVISGSDAMELVSAMASLEIKGYLLKDWEMSELAELLETIFSELELSCKVPAEQQHPKD